MTQQNKKPDALPLPRIETYVSAQGEKFWIKRHDQNKKKIGHHILGFFTFFIPLKILKPTVANQSADGLIPEAKRMEKFREQGFSVPEIIKSEKDVMVTRHLGEILPKLIEVQPYSEQKKLILQAADALLGVHRAGLCHGRPHIKDMVLTERGQIGFLDFEEDPVAVMGLARAQARDIFVFSMSISRFLNAHDLRFVCHALLAKSPSEIKKELNRLISFLNPICRLLLFLKIKGKDVAHLTKTQQAFYKIFFTA